MGSVNKRLISMRHKEKLKFLINEFLVKCNGKSRKEVMELYYRYENMWEHYAENVNGHNKRILIMVDDFESCVRVDGVATMTKMKHKLLPKIYNDYIKVLEYLEYKTWYQHLWYNIKHWIRKNGS